MSLLALAPVIRPYDPEIDEALVMDSWCKAITLKWVKPRAGAGKPIKIRPFANAQRQHKEVHRGMIELLINRFPPLIAHPKGYPDQIYGYACGGVVGPIRVLHMAYTRFPFRKKGIMAALLQEIWREHQGPGFFTYETRLKRNNDLWAHLCKKHNVAWNPYVVAFSGG